MKKCRHKPASSERLRLCLDGPAVSSTSITMDGEIFGSPMDTFIPRSDRAAELAMSSRLSLFRISADISDQLRNWLAHEQEHPGGAAQQETLTTTGRWI